MDEKSYLQEIKEYQMQMEQQLRAPNGWLTLAGLHWLKEGKNSVGAALSNAVPLPPYSAPLEVGDLFLEDGKVHFQPQKGVDVRQNGDPINDRIYLEPDINRDPTIVTLGDISFFVIIRGERIGVRVKNTSSPNRLNFSGRIWWPVDERYRVKAGIKSYNPQKMVTITDVLGDEKESPMDCALEFSLGNQSFSLDAFGLPSGQYYILFHDLSCGQGSYPAGRFLVTEYPDEDSVVIDFNKAHNPPCAFTPFATCPLPPQQNYLQVKISAGERYHNSHSHEHSR